VFRHSANFVMSSTAELLRRWRFKMLASIAVDFGDQAA
jgi:hypothetical protein